MARKLITDKRWCVSGTPIGRHNLNDLYGLFMFMSFSPFDEKDWLNHTLVPSRGDTMKPLSHLLRKVMWRSTKQNCSVREQMGIPEQIEKKVKLKFSGIEKHFYERQYQEAASSIKHWLDAGRPDKLHHELNKLRAACCHPQVGASGIGGRSSKILTMEEILMKLIEDSKVRCEEAQRVVVMHTNGMACLSKLKSECEESDGGKKNLMAKSLKTYQMAIDLMNESVQPTVLLGKAILSGSIGFRLSDKVLNCDTLRLDWQIKCITENDGCEVWSELNFSSPKRLSCIKIQPCRALPHDIDSSWTILEPKECILQMSSDGGCFIDVGSVLLTTNDDEENSWKKIPGSRGKSKAYRLVIKSFHPMSSTSYMQPRNYYVGLNLEFFEPQISDDPLQRLHTLHNASDVLSSMLQKSNFLADNYDNEKARLTRMEFEAQMIHDSYMSRAQAFHRQRQLNLSIFKQAREKCEEQLNELSTGSDQDWYEDVLGWLAIYGSEGQQREMVEAVKSELESYFGNMNAKKTGVQELNQILIRSGRFPTFSNVRGLHAALQLRIQQEDRFNESDTKRCLETVAKLPGTPSTGEVMENSRCQRCREDWEQTGPICKHCLLEDDLNKMEKHFNDPEISCVLKAITKVVKDQAEKSYGRHKSYMRTMQGRATKHTALQHLVKEEIKAAKSFWRAHFDLLSDIDELNQCKRSMRLQRDGECISMFSQNEAKFIVDRNDVDAEYFDHEAKQASALGEMKRNKGTVRFLTNEMNQQSSAESSDCVICLKPFQDDERYVFMCGHSFHRQCVEGLCRRSTRDIIPCPMKCSVTTRRVDLLLASNKNKEDEIYASHNIKGNWGTKVNHLIRDIIDIIKLGDKGIVFSQWEDMLDVVAEGLTENAIHFIRPKGGKRFDIKLFRSSRSKCQILLMNVKNGAEGLTLTEANHCFMLEPILNHSIDAQAINRIHRIGQTSKTYVHRYIVENTVEEKIDEMRMEREANHFEDDIVQDHKDHFYQTEIDQIFG